jgi:pimeloyl-ACP methyl ester carboxylesterase
MPICGLRTPGPLKRLGQHRKQHAMNDSIGYRSFFIRSRDGLKLHVREYGEAGGEALPVICLHGLARTSADFHELALFLSADGRRPRRVIALEYRGRGRSEYDRTWSYYDL